jgi:diamine N-acetyltransferase
MIFGERIRFRAIDRDDLPTFVSWINDPEIRQGIGIYLPYAMADEENWFDEMRKRSADEHNLAIEVRLPSERVDIPGEQAGLPNLKLAEPASEVSPDRWKLIGSCGFFNLDQRNRSSEFGIMIGEKSYWNKGYGTEAVRLLCQHGFQTLNLNRIYLRVLESNPRAIRAYEKAGFTHEGRQRQAEYRDGKYIDMLVMSMLKEEF